MSTRVKLARWIIPLIALMAWITASSRVSAVDCNNNGVEDADDIVLGTSEDCQPDGVPDECGIPVECSFSHPSPVEQSDNWLGHSLSLAGDWLCVGASNDTDPAYVYDISSGDLVLSASLDDQGADSSITFGFVSTDGTRIIVGQPSAYASRGAAVVYLLVGSTWQFETELLASDGAGGDEFGAAVAIEGNSAVIGAPDDGGRGSVYLFTFDGTNWVESDKIESSDSNNDDFGITVALDGQRVLVGDFRKDCNAGNTCGAVYYYLISVSGASLQFRQQLTDPSTQGDASFGSSLAMVENVAVIGARSAPCGGAAHIYRFNGTQWTAEQELKHNTCSNHTRFGVSVAYDGNTVLVGATGDDTSCIDCGAVYGYSFDGTEWVQVETILPLESEEDEWFGYALALDGNRRFIGAPREACSDGEDCGKLYEVDYDLRDTDCNCNGVADECDLDDCNGNLIPDSCDIVSETSPDCNLNWVPDECEVGGLADCNGNSKPDLCDIFEQTSIDCIGNGIPDECEPDGNGNGVPDECDAAPFSIHPAKNRYVSLVIPTVDARVIQVKILEMPQFPAREGEVWWAGPQTLIADVPHLIAAARLECTATPHVQVWNNGPLYLFGEPIIPLWSSVSDTKYEVRTCKAEGTGCSDPVIVVAGRLGDVTPTFYAESQNEPTFTDITAIVDKFKLSTSAPRIFFADIAGSGPAGQPNTPDQKVDFTDISLAVDAFKGLSYPFAVPACAP